MQWPVTIKIQDTLAVFKTPTCYATAAVKQKAQVTLFPEPSIAARPPIGTPFSRGAFYRLSRFSFHHSLHIEGF